MKDIFSNLADFLFECNALTRVKRGGDMLINNPLTQNVSDHIFRSLIISYFLSKLEDVDENKVLKMSLFRDLYKSRSLDLHKVAIHYIDREKVKQNIRKDQHNLLDSKSKREANLLSDELEEKKTPEAMVALDANYLAEAIFAKESIERGVKMNDWMDNIKKALKTDSAKKLFSILKKTSSENWWKKLKYIPEIERGSQNIR